MITLKYNKNVGYSDAHAIKIAITDIHSGNDNATYEFGNQTYLNEWRIAIKNGFISTSQLQLFYDDIEITINKKGEIHDWPKGFFDETDKQYQILFDF